MGDIVDPSMTFCHEHSSITHGKKSCPYCEIVRLREALNIARSSDIAYLIGLLEGLGQEIPPFILHNHNRWKAHLGEQP